MIETEFALAAINFLLQKRTENCTELTDIEFSVLAEIGNIISRLISVLFPRFRGLKF
jgi:hypothetical protein